MILVTMESRVEPLRGRAKGVARAVASRVGIKTLRLFINISLRIGFESTEL